jgi:hypothetical protein
MCYNETVKVKYEYTQNTSCIPNVTGSIQAHKDELDLQIFHNLTKDVSQFITIINS